MSFFAFSLLFFPFSHPFLQGDKLDESPSDITQTPCTPPLHPLRWVVWTLKLKNHSGQVKLDQNDLENNNGAVRFFIGGAKS